LHDDREHLPHDRVTISVAAVDHTHARGIGAGELVEQPVR